MKFNITAGVIERSRLLAFETMLWRVSKGNVFLKFADIYEQMEDPNSGNKLYKAVFMVFFQGDALRSLGTAQQGMIARHAMVSATNVIPVGQHVPTTHS